MKGHERSRRLSTISRLVETAHIDGQEHLLRLLRAEGYSITQATLSRDINELKIVKVPDGEGGYRYSRHSQMVLRGATTPTSGLVSIEISGQMGVIRTQPGYASIMAAAIDEAQLPSVMGTIAGDDTVLIVLRKDADSEVMMRELQRLLPKTQ